MTDTSLAFVHRLVPATAPGRAPLLLLHGTGGDEADLLPLGASLAPGAALLSPRGTVLERGMPRFFGRLAEGVFDQEEVRRRALDLADFVVAAGARYGLPAPVAVGYSNGANVAAAMLLLRPGLLAGAILLRPMQVYEGAATGLAPTPVLILSGAADPIVPGESVAALATQLAAAGVRVERRTLRAGHQLTSDDIALARSWLALAFPASP